MVSIYRAFRNCNFTNLRAARTAKSWGSVVHYFFLLKPRVFVLLSVTLPAFSPIVEQEDL